MSQQVVDQTPKTAIAPDQAGLQPNGLSGGSGPGDEGLFDLVDGYKNMYRDAHRKNTTEYFETLVKNSGIDVEQNRATNKQIKEGQTRLQKLASQIRKRTAAMVLLIILLLLAVGGVFSQITSMVNGGFAFLSFLFTFIGLGVVGLSIFFLIKVRRSRKELKSSKEKLEKEVEELIAQAWEQMRPLNELFTSKMSPELFAKTLPLVQFDRAFDSRRMDYFNGKFGLSQDPDNNRSAFYVQSGEIQGNPFFLATDLVHEMGTKTYTGSITIHWTTSRMQNGKWVTQNHTQTLTASVQKPCPYYKKQTYLVYGNEAAPDLVFTRRDSDAEKMNQKQIDKQVQKTLKKLDKKARKSLSSGGDFTVMGNSEFEVLFGATDRNNEVQFRLLFTPLAQRQLLELMKDKEAGFGDEFGFAKRNKLNILIPKHMQNFQLNVPPTYFQGYDFDEVQNRFITYNMDFFRQVYFALAPVLAIPLYMQQRPSPYRYQDSYGSRMSFYEHEYVANNMGIEFAHPQSNTPNILKTTVIGSDGQSDMVSVISYGYHTEERVDYITKLGGDGKMHTIPVHWTEYIPVWRETPIVVNPVEVEEQTNAAGTYRQTIEKLVQEKKLNPQDIYRTGHFLAYLLRL